MAKTDNVKDFFKSLKRILAFKEVITEETGQKSPCEFADLLKNVNKRNFGSFEKDLICYIPGGIKGVKKIYVNCESTEDESYHNFKSLEEVILSPILVTLGEGSFYGCEKLESVTAGPLLKQVKFNCFYDCKALATLEGFENVERVGLNSFYNTAFVNNHLGGPIYIGKVLYEYKGQPTTDEVTIEHDLTFILDNACASKKIKELTIKNTSADNVLNISYNAFNSSYLEKVYIDSRTSLTNGCFNNCPNIKEVHISHLEQAVTPFPHSDLITEFYFLNDAGSMPTKIEGFAKFKDKATFYVKPEAKAAWEKILVGYNIQSSSENIL